MTGSEPRFYAIKDALRVALVMPVSFALALHVFDSRAMALFASFGPMALLVFVQFGGRWRTRLLAYTLLALGGAGLIALGTLCSRTPWLATAVMAVVGFGIIFAGVFDEYVAAAQRGAILAFVLAVMVPADPAAIAPRVAGWGLAAALSIAAVLLLWPRRAPGAVRGAAGVAALRLADLAELAAAGGDATAVAAAHEEVKDAIREARRRFVSLPHRPSGNGGRIAALARTIDHMSWLRPLAARATGSDLLLGIAAERTEIERQVPLVLRQIGARLQGAPAAAGPRPAELRAAHQRLGGRVVERFERLPADADESALSADLDEAYRLRQLAFGTLQLAADAAVTCGDSAPGEGRKRARARVAETGRQARAHATMRSVWLRNSVRGAVGLAAAVLVAQLTDLQNGFWVVLGTISVLRSSALATGTTIVLGLLGTLAGIVLGGLLIAAVGTEPAVLWPLLPLAVFLAAYAMRAVSFAAGQAAFSFVVLVLFNLINPVGWEVGLIRVQDVAIGAGISLLTGLLIWPRGATAVMRQALASAYEDAAASLEATVRALLGGADAVRLASLRAFESAQQLDATLRAYLSEQSAGRGGVEDLGLLAAGATRLRRIARLVTSAQVLARLRPVDAELPRVAAARDALEDELDARCAWFRALALAIADAEPAPRPEEEPPTAAAAREVVLERAAGEEGVPPGLAIAWARRHLELLRELEPPLAGAADAIG
ncbi:MAG: FUSC family protein [Actinobacteria bacterium]|nr:FUSC family protein [Actinomycetota bacterium]